MSKRLLLDTGPLGMIAHPKVNIDFQRWFESKLLAGLEICIPEICDYELRREFILQNMTKSLERLDQLKQNNTYLPLNTNTMLKAAFYWAQSRRNGRPTSDPKELDGDVILAAQATEEGDIVITDNPVHLGQFVNARRWTEI